MNILIVNGFGKSERGKESFDKFCNIIDNLLKKVSFKSGIENFLYSYRSIEELDDFVYNLPSNEKASDEKKLEFRKNFDKLDLIFVDGKEKNYLPWMSQGQKLLALIELCEKTGKIIFAGGIAMLTLIYYLATNGNYKNFINSNGEFPSIEDLSKIPYDYLTNLKREDAFLDFVTGDVYEFKSTNEWVPIMNIGIHKLLYAEKFHNRGKYVTKEYHLSKNKDLVSTTKKEIKMKIIKQYCLHWLVKNLPVEFVANTTLTWYTHNICVNNKINQFKVICDSNFGSMIIEHRNSIGVMFHIQKNFPHSITILHNFIAKKFIEVQTKTSYIEQTEQFESEEAKKLFKCVVKEPPPDYASGITLNCTNPKSTENLVNKSRFFYNTSFNNKEGKHCGLSYNNRDMIFLSNNAVIKEKIPYNKNVTETDIASPIKLTAEQILGDDYDYLKIDPSWDDEKLIEFYKKKGREICKLLQDSQTIDTSANKLTRKSSKINKPPNKSNFSSKNTSSYASSRINSSKSKTANNFSSTSKVQSKVSQWGDNNNSKSNTNLNNNMNNIKAGFQQKKKNENESVLTMLFPYIKEEDFQMKTFNPEKSEEKNLEVIRLNQERRIKSNFNDKFKKYDKELNTFRDKPSIRCSSAYVTEDEKRRREFIESKKLWMCPEDFRRVFGKRTLNSNMKKETSKEDGEYIPNIFKEPDYEHQFREFDKTRWVSKRDFVV